MEDCENCGTRIGKLETPHLWQERVVCAECHKKLTVASARSMASPPIVSLKCENCGGSLEVSDDIERFACQYCGAEMLVQRRGGTVSLHKVTEAIRGVQKGTDKTAAELAIARLNKELQDLKIAQKKLDAQATQSGCGIGCLSVIMLIAIVAMSAAGPNACGGAMLALGLLGCIGLVVSTNQVKEKRGTISEAIELKESQIQQKTRIANE